MITFLEIKKSLGFPFLKIENLSNFRFMFFDTYEIHIQALVVFSDGKCSIFNPHLRKNILRNIYIYICICVYIQNISNTNNFETIIHFFRKKDGFAFQFLFFQILDTHISKNNIFKNDYIFSCILKSILVIVRRALGPDFDEIFEVPGII